MPRRAPAAKHDRTMRWLVADALVLGYALTPVLWLISLSVRPSPGLAGGRFVPRVWSLRSYAEIFATSEFIRALGNSVGIAAVSTAVAVGVGALAAYALARLAVPGRRAFLAGTLGVAVFPQIALITPLFDLERRLGLFDSWAGLILPNVACTLPLAIYVLAAFFRELPRELEEVARVDGATPVQTLRFIIAPLAAPGLVTAALLVFIVVWNDFLFAISLTSTPAARTVPAALAFFTGASQFEDPTGTIAAAAVVITIPVVLLVLVFQRRIVAGLTAGAVTG